MNGRLGLTYIYTIDTMYKIELTVEHTELYLTLCIGLNEKEIQKRGEINQELGVNI